MSSDLAQAINNVFVQSVVYCTISILLFPIALYQYYYFQLN